MIVVFEKGRGERPITRVDGKVAFPDRRWTASAPPQTDEAWEVEISGENPQKTVVFLRPIRKLAGTWRLVWKTPHAYLEYLPKEHFVFLRSGYNPAGRGNSYEEFTTDLDEATEASAQAVAWAAYEKKRKEKFNESVLA